MLAFLKTQNIYHFFYSAFPENLNCFHRAKAHVPLFFPWISLFPAQQSWHVCCAHPAAVPRNPTG